VKSIEARMRSLRTQTGKSIIKAPFSGTIDKIFANNGEMAGPQSPILRLVNNSTVDITADISEKHLAKMKIGTPIEVTFPNFTDTSLQLAITYVGNLQLNHVSGGVRCKTYFLHASEMVSLEIIKDNFFEAFNILERYMPGIMAIVYAGKDADTAINDLLGTVNPTNN
jgi:hypothetical protein